MGLRCVCPQGHPLHIKHELAGQRGICPRCGSPFTIPLEGEEEASPAAPLEGAPPPLPPLPEAVEWRAASPSGEQYGPTVPPLFAQWITQGRIEPDWQVWRTGWTDWRLASEAGADLPAPLPVAPASETPPPLAKPPQETPPSPQEMAPGAVAKYARRRKQGARQLRLIVSLLGVVVLALLGLLGWLLVR